MVFGTYHFLVAQNVRTFLKKKIKHSNTWSNLSIHKGHSHTLYLTSMDWNAMEYAVYVYSVRYLKISSRFQMLQQMSQQI